MPGVVAALAQTQWSPSKQYVQKDHDLASLYSEAVAGCDWLIPQTIPPEGGGLTLFGGSLGGIQPVLLKTNNDLIVRLGNRPCLSPALAHDTFETRLRAANVEADNVHRMFGMKGRLLD